MLWVYLSDGRTLHFDLTDADGEKAWQEREKDAAFQGAITGVALYYDETLHTLTKPRGFRRVRYRAEITQSKGRPVERLVMSADDIEVEVKAYRNDAVPKVTALKLRRGRRVFKPSRRS